MANKKFSDLTAATSFGATDSVAIVQGGVSKKATRSVVLASCKTTVDTYANRPAQGIAGQRFISTDGCGEWIDDGTAWRPIIGGKLGTAPPAASGFTCRSDSGVATTIVDEYGALKMAHSNSSGVQVRVASKALGAVTRVEAHVRLMPSTRNAADYSYAGIGFRNSADGKIEMVGVYYKPSDGTSRGLDRLRYTASNTGTSPVYTFSANDVTRLPAAGFFPSGFWLAITHNGAGGVRGYEFSIDGSHWQVIPEMAVTGSTFLGTPDEFLLHAFQSTGTSGDLTGAIFDSLKLT